MNWNVQVEGPEGQAHGPIYSALSLSLPAHRDLSQHHHPGLSPGVQLASAE